MSQHFSPKSLLFYGCAIVSVTTLFWIASTYGEAHLKPPNKIDGRYQINTSNLPGCLKSPLMLAIQQSGIYLTGALLPIDIPESELRQALERPPLTGMWNNEQLQLQGSVANLPNCQGTIDIQGAIQGNVSHGTINQAVMTGTVRLSSVAEATQFKAPQLDVEPTATGGRH